jgi:ATP-binding cassette subfamily F protein 3
VLLVSHDRALLDAVATRLLAIEDQTVRSYDGGWAEYVRAQAEEAAPVEPPPPKPEKPKKPAAPPKKKGPTRLDRIEAEIATREAKVAELERRLAEDWSDVDTVAAHRRVRDELQALLTEWEELFESSR